ncbi:hydrogenase maturation protease [Saccharopolyspora erythraea NRRL 2338]|uniref:Hydrogenase maturation protein HupD n=2 Tax=Saccharopolyspora erythraea TaxID=1836 RepID=A4FE62_SACEN|nr:hydrogenase maturation protease [Saccharopolyspora erythraea]EQD85167.1 peptidase M52 [Saccharopolyspora erythraea D]PFG96065.1 hydrogenase maturation protease [Saccharopolyspora erythraea NRRL 2338]QRK92611.1 hydrogenase maturation protease [Saccharopolyspora erythraea]CAM02337.1 hydrogenase maturation protein HupD [Saccharopolyspora erythraea NRRL 2338]
MSGKVLVAGIGNVFLGDDGFGVEVVGRLLEEEHPAGVRVADFGVRGVHLAYELMNGYDAVVLVDAVPLSEEPGTVQVVEVDLDAVEPAAPGAAAPVMDAHGMTPDAVFGLFRALGGSVGRALVVGCRPLDCSERMGLSEPVAGAVDRAAGLVRELVGELTAAPRAEPGFEPRR